MAEKTGYDSAYNELLERGARVIVIKEKDASLKTYIRTLNSNEYEFEHSK